MYKYDVHIHASEEIEKIVITGVSISTQELEKR